LKITKALASPGHLQPCPIYTIDGRVQKKAVTPQHFLANLANDRNPDSLIFAEKALVKTCRTATFSSRHSSRRVRVGKLKAAVRLLNLTPLNAYSSEDGQPSISGCDQNSMPALSCPLLCSTVCISEGNRVLPGKMWQQAGKSNKAIIERY
jgi:hypothetical protein